METRRIRRLERRRGHRTTALAASLAVIGVAVGMELPRSNEAPLALLAVAAGALLLVTMRADARAPLHGLHRVVRLPLPTALGATVASHRARVAGTLRALVHRRPALAPVVLDEPDDEADAWWGPPPAELAPWPPIPPTPDPSVAPEPAEPSPVLLSPVLAAPMETAHVPAADVDRVVLMRHWLRAARRFARRMVGYADSSQGSVDPAISRSSFE